MKKLKFSCWNYSIYSKAIEGSQFFRKGKKKSKGVFVARILRKFPQTFQLKKRD